MARPFTDILSDIRNGRIVAKATEQMQVLTKEVMRTQRPGSIDLKIVIKPHDQDDGTVVLVPKLTVKMPQGDLPEGLFFTDADGSLLRDDPNKRPLFSPVPAAAGAEAEERIDPETGEVLERKA